MRGRASSHAPPPFLSNVVSCPCLSVLRLTCASRRRKVGCRSEFFSGPVRGRLDSTRFVSAVNPAAAAWAVRPVFSCSCCPSSILTLLASWGCLCIPFPLSSRALSLSLSVSLVLVHRLWLPSDSTRSVRFLPRLPALSSRNHATRIIDPASL